MQRRAMRYAIRFLLHSNVLHSHNVSRHVPVIVDTYRTQLDLGSFGAKRLTAHSGARTTSYAPKATRGRGVSLLAYQLLAQQMPPARSTGGKLALSPGGV